MWLAPERAELVALLHFPSMKNDIFVVLPDQDGVICHLDPWSGIFVDQVLLPLQNGTVTISMAPAGMAGALAAGKLVSWGTERCLVPTKNS